MSQDSERTLPVWLATLPGEFWVDPEHRRSLNAAACSAQMQTLLSQHGLSFPESGCEVICSLLSLSVCGIYDQRVHNLNQAQRCQYDFWRVVAGTTQLLMLSVNSCVPLSVWSPLRMFERRRPKSFFRVGARPRTTAVASAGIAVRWFQHQPPVACSIRGFAFRRRVEVDFVAVAFEDGRAYVEFRAEVSAEVVVKCGVI